jgi:type II secretory pathway pseudopilin PulG
MGRIIALAVLMTSMIVFSSPQTKAQQANLSQAQRQQAIFRQTQDSAMAAAAGPEFCQRGPCPGFENVAALHRSMFSKAPKPAGQSKASGPFPPQPYQPSRSELQAAAQSAAATTSGLSSASIPA